MTNFYIAAAWVLTFGAVGAYALSLVLRGRRLSRAVPADRRRWMGAPSTEGGALGAGGLLGNDPVVRGGTNNG